MVGRQLEKTVDRLHSECRFPMQLPTIPEDPFVSESEGNGKSSRSGFGNLTDSSRGTVVSGETRDNSLVFLDESVVTTPNCCDKSDS